jgi:DNA helicase INO80
LQIEVDLMVELSPRQKVLYRALRSSASIRALLSQAADMQDTTKVNSLMNVVMQFRKVCHFVPFTACVSP